TTKNFSDKLFFMYNQSSSNNGNFKYVREGQITVKIKRLREDSRIPSLGTQMSTGYDLYYVPTKDYKSENIYLKDIITVNPGQTVLIPTGISIEPPEGLWCAVHGRSSTNKRGILVHTGIIDNDYRGEIMVVATNVSERIIFIEPYTKIAQIVFYNLIQVHFEETDKLSETSRNEGGFGSTGN
ncbi:MAG: dUTP diphosphatase, partial [Candidatus Dojkabacteria bacterium]|nr:dUTP diphosphatase [Candidatus Dojkabacteria bacterium]